MKTVWNGNEIKPFFNVSDITRRYYLHSSYIYIHISVLKAACEGNTEKYKIEKSLEVRFSLSSVSLKCSLAVSVKMQLNG